MTLCAGLLVCLLASAQVDRKEVRKGNRDFRKENYKEAEIDYRKALVKDTASFAANYNLANTLYRTRDMGQAKKYLDTLKAQAPMSLYAADYYYNSGNIAVGMKDWQAAVDSYMQSLLRNPGDLEAKENFIYALKMLQNQQQNGGGGRNDQNNDNKEQNQDNNKDNNDNGQDQEDKDQQNQDGQNRQDNQDQNRKDQPDQQGQQEQPKISPQAAQQMLQAIQAKEKETQDKVNKEKANAMKARQKEKNW